MALIYADNLHKTYTDGTHALRGVSLSIDPGEFVAIMGPSGSGKSTLLHILGLLDNYTEGTYCFNGRDVKEISRPELARMRNETMGFVFQTFNLLPRVNAFDNILLPLMYSHIPEKEWQGRAERALSAVNLLHRKTHEPAKLSGGERQRAAIARALITEPDIIFADEPTGNLDSKAGESVMSILQRLNSEGHTIVLITHEEYIAEHARRIVVMLDGRMTNDRAVTNQRIAQERP